MFIYSIMHNKIELIQSIHYDDLNVKFIFPNMKVKGFQ